MDQMETLTEALRAVGLNQRREFKPPSYEGEGDVMLFVRHFHDVAEANNWTQLERTLHLRSSLHGGAQSCGQGETFDEIVEDLQARYGTTRKQAMDKLAAMKVKPPHPAHEQAAEVSRLVGLAYPNLPAADQRTMALDCFMRSLEGKDVKSHMLAVNPQTIRDAARAADEYFAIHSSAPRAMPVEDVGPPSLSPLEQGVAALSEAIQQQMMLLQQLVERMNQASPQPVPQKTVACYNCGGPHLKRRCPQLRASNNQAPSSPSGNATGPAQV